ncbi:MAG: hypothetical protein V3T86_09825 [Planctomycetota bacterium]
MRNRAALSLVLLAGCVPSLRPIDPWGFEGYPGGQVAGWRFELRDGRRWTFRDDLDPEAEPMLLALAQDGDEFELRGRKQGDLTVAVKDGYLEIHHLRSLVERPLKFEGVIGSRWTMPGARGEFFGFDELEVLGEKIPTLVVAIDRHTDVGRRRDIYWFAMAKGWVRIRSELDGRPQRDMRLVEFEPGSSN